VGNLNLCSCQRGGRERREGRALLPPPSPGAIPPPTNGSGVEPPELSDWPRVVHVMKTVGPFMKAGGHPSRLLGPSPQPPFQPLPIDRHALMRNCGGGGTPQACVKLNRGLWGVDQGPSERRRRGKDQWLDHQPFSQGGYTPTFPLRHGQ